MKHYETLYIVNPELEEEDYKAVVGKFKDLIEKEKGVIVKLEEWGKQRLAYLIKKVDQGAYVLMDYCGGAGITAVLERDLKLDDRILKYQTVKLADEVEPQALVQKEEEAKKETAATEDQAEEKEEIAQDEKIKTAATEDQAQEKKGAAQEEKIESDTSDKEVNNGI
jgi:small subunit ribosomal protein S6